MTTTPAVSPSLARIIRISGALYLSLLGVAPVAARGEPPRDRAEKNAVRGMTGTFDGIGLVVWVSRDEAQQLLPAGEGLRLDYPDTSDRYPIVLLLGSQQDVGVQFGRGYIHPRFLKHYENAYVIIPYLRHPAVNGYAYTFSRIYVSDERVVDEGSKLNHSPKVHATIEDQRDRFVVDFEGQRRIDVSIRDALTSVMLKPAANPGERKPTTTADFLRAVFKEPKIEFSPNPHLFEFDFMADASGLRPAAVSGTIVLQGAADGPSKPVNIAVLSPGESVEAVRFSGHWTKKPE
jgi:hypothetical protein